MWFPELFENSLNRISLIENLLEANESYPQTSAHEKFLLLAQPESCRSLKRVPLEFFCDFIRLTEDCLEDTGFIRFMEYAYCSLGQPGSTEFQIGNIYLVLVCFVCFVTMGTVANNFLCPSLEKIAQTLHMSDTLAGVTLLAYGNGAIDVITALAGDPHSDTELMFNELFGASAFVMGFVAGIILIIRPCQVYKRTYLRDVLFFLTGLLFIIYANFNATLRQIDGIILVCIYCGYLAYVIIDYIFSKSSDNEKSIELQTETEIEIESIQHEIEADPVRQNNENLFSEFLDHISPIDFEEFMEYKWYRKIWSLVVCPTSVAIVLLIPVVDQDKPRNGWCKLLNMLQCMILPVFIIFAFRAISILTISIAVGAGTVLAIIIFFTSQTHTPPVYHIGFAFISFLGSLVVIYVTVIEIISILDTLGYIFGISKSVLAVTILAWGNCIGDLFSNMALAKKGHHEMAFAACFGGPIFNVIFGLGSTIFYRSSALKQETISAKSGIMGMTSQIFMILIVVIPLIAISMTNFQARASIGYLMVIVYLTFMSYCFLIEGEIIHPHDTNHMLPGEDFYWI